MSYIPFVTMFPEKARLECRVIHIRNHETIPDDDYALSESYCVDHGCDCRRVLFNIIPRSSWVCIATVSCGLDRDRKDAEPVLDPLHPQCYFAPQLLEVITGSELSDPAYASRLESHYNEVKRAVEDPGSPVHRLIASYLGNRAASPLVGRNDKCPCGSGKKYRKCCKPKAPPIEQKSGNKPRARVAFVDDIDELDSLSNSVPDLVRAGRLDEAEEACQELLRRFPDMVDGLERSAMVYEAKGDREKAREYYQKTITFMETNPGFDPEGIDWVREEMDRL
jgi:tetratricopeptide (TPR) repeat protein